MITSADRVSLGHLIDIQLVSVDRNLPTESDLIKWAQAALRGQCENAELTLRLVDEQEITELNRTYRHKAVPTNVLAFPFTNPSGVESNLLGDVVIAAPVVKREALEQHRSAESHWAHMVVHGILHLLGYDHLDESQALEMEAMEKTILADLGFPDPYLI